MDERPHPYPDGDKGPLIWRRPVGTATTYRASTGGGTLFVYPGRLVLRMGGVSRRTTGLEEVVHTRPSVRLLKERIAAPWCNTMILLEGSTETVGAAFPATDQRKLRRVLRQAGFEVLEEWNWLMGRVPAS
jgi:hypothetical protein